MPSTYAEYQQSVARAVGHVIERALEPSPRVARHWEATSRLTWVGGGADHHQVHVSWSFGRLRDAPVLDRQRHTVGVFTLNKAAFPGVDELALRTTLEALIPAGTDGATRVFLQRVTAQLAVADVLVTLPERLGCEVSLFARPDALDTHASTPRWPEHARDRVAAALTAMDPLLAARLDALWRSPVDVLLAAALSASP